MKWDKDVLVWMFGCATTVKKILYDWLWTTYHWEWHGCASQGQMSRMASTSHLTLFQLYHIAPKTKFIINDLDIAVWNCWDCGFYFNRLYIQNISNWQKTVRSLKVTFYKEIQWSPWADEHTRHFHLHSTKKDFFKHIFRF